MLGSLLQVLLASLVLHIGRELARLLEHAAEIEHLLPRVGGLAGLLGFDAPFELLLLLQEVVDLAQRILQEGSASTRSASVLLRLAGLFARQLLQLLVDRLLVGTGVPLGRALGVLLQLLLALLCLANPVGQFTELRDLLFEVLDRPTLQQDVEQALDVRDDLLLLAQGIGQGVGGEIVADAGDVLQQAGALEVLQSLLQQVDLLGLVLARVTLQQPVHQVAESASFAQDLVLVAAQPLELLLRILFVALRDRCRDHRSA